MIAGIIVWTLIVIVIVGAVFCNYKAKSNENTAGGFLQFLTLTLVALPSALIGSVLMPLSEEAQITDLMTFGYYSKAIAAEEKANELLEEPTNPTIVDAPAQDVRKLTVPTIAGAKSWVIQLEIETGKLGDGIVIPAKGVLKDGRLFYRTDDKDSYVEHFK